MFTQLIIELLIASLLLLLAGWANDVLHASTHEGPSYLNRNEFIDWDQIRRSRKPLRYADPDSTWCARPVRTNADRIAAAQEHVDERQILTA
jgi:hypothetical protein